MTLLKALTLFATIATLAWAGFVIYVSFTVSNELDRQADQIMRSYDAELGR